MIVEAAEVAATKHDFERVGRLWRRGREERPEPRGQPDDHPTPHLLPPAPKLHISNIASVSAGVHPDDEKDEFFLVLEGKIYLDVEGGETVELSKGQGYTVPKRVVHRPRAPERAVILMVEKASVKPTGD